MSLIVLLFAGCVTTSPFDQHTYQQTTAVKVETLALMNKAVNDYSQHGAESVAVEMQLDKLYEYEPNRPNNSITI